MGQFDLFGGADTASDAVFTIKVPEEEWDDKHKLALEREMLGLYVSGHPLNCVAHLLTTQVDTQIPAILGRIAQPDLTADLLAALTYLKAVDGVRKGGYGVSGFCFGGSQTFALATASPDIKAAVPYYGTAKVEDLPKSQAAFLNFYGETDTRVTGTAQAVEQALKAALVDGLRLAPRKAFAPVRVAVTGHTVSPPLYESMELLGRDRSLHRLRGALRGRGE